MYIPEEQLEALAARYGAPRLVRLQVEILPDELAMVHASRKHGRRHDFTVFALDGDRVVVIRKRFHPPGVYRAPSGGVKPGEAIEAGILREMWEETGLQVALDRYLLRLGVRFTCGTELEDWTSHVVSAHVVEGKLGPVDVEEIQEARYVTLEELQGPIRKALLDSGRGLLRYRLMLTDLSVDLVSSPRASEVDMGAPGRTIDSFPSEFKQL